MIGTTAHLRNLRTSAVVWFGLLAAASALAQTDQPPQDEDYGLHGQFTNVTQFHPSFRSPYQGPNSLNPGDRSAETSDLTFYAGARLWDGGEVYADPEVDEGFGLSDTLGVAGYTSGEAYKIGAAAPYVRLHRAFFRQTFGLGGHAQAIEPDQNQLGGSKLADNLTLTVGKFSVVDIFDTNDYAHDPRSDFLNWSLIDSGAFDYAADPWGYTYGAAAEWTQSWWTLRGGLFDLSRIPNNKALQHGFGQFEADIEGEERHRLFDHDGKVKLLVFVNRARMASYDDAIRVGQASGGVPDVSTVRHYQTRPGFALNLQQELTDGLGVFARLSANDGTKETYEFTEINRSLAIGLSLKGTGWDRKDDVVGLALVGDELSPQARAYFAAGGLGILIGDGKLPHYGVETIVETYYKATVSDGVFLTFDYQFVANPAYNSDRGPVSVFSTRVHLEF
jgi:high affinity Mn2+ porin